MLQSVLLLFVFLIVFVSNILKRTQHFNDFNHTWMTHKFEIQVRRCVGSMVGAKNPTSDRVLRRKKNTCLYK